MTLGVSGSLWFSLLSISKWFVQGDFEKSPLLKDGGFLKERKDRQVLVKKLLRDLAKNKPVGWQERSVKLLRKSWEASPAEELKRLRFSGVVDDTVDARLEGMIRSCPGGSISSD